MDTPLLALTRRRVRTSEGALGSDINTENMRQMVQLRWLAVFGQLITVIVAAYGLGIALPVLPMLAVAAVAALVNIASLPLLRHRRIRHVDLLVALLFDVGSLTIQLYLSGGATNPFIWLYLLQVVLGAILLGRPRIWIIVAAAGICFACLTRFYRPLIFPPQLQPFAQALYLIGGGLCFGLIGVLLVLFVTRIVRNLSVRDAHLSDLRQLAAEEDHLVRMGLFASGAAHELGTPLATLSVILGDWRRMPRFAGDAELMSEIAEMQSEVQRCKAIVTDVLHSVAEAPENLPERTYVRAFLRDLLKTWHAIHPSARLEVIDAVADDLMIAVDPAFRQALWNILDNAAEASTGPIVVEMLTNGATLSVAIRDSGPGFPPSVLNDVGRPQRSSKGAGHGVGLFLVASVMRKLGGTISARNRDAGGAELRLELPLDLITVREFGE